MNEHAIETIAMTTQPKPNEYKGSFYEIRECEFEKNGSYETREVEVNYYIWYKVVN